jgi:hypothetical protein
MEIPMGRLLPINIPLCLLVISTALLSCAKESSRLVGQISSEITYQNGDRFLVTDIQVNIGKLYLPDTVIALSNDYGMFRSYNQKDKNYLGLDLNIEEILNVPSTSMPVLPNGNPIPLNANGVEVIELPISGTQGSVYIAVSGGVAMIGVATVIKNLEQLRSGAKTRRKKTADIFKQYKIGKINVLAGVFTSTDNQKNGVAVFADMAHVWNPSFNFQFDQTLIFNPKYVKRRIRKELRRKLRQVMKKRMKIEFH